MDSTSCEAANPLSTLVQSILVSLWKQADENNVGITPAEKRLLLPTKISETAQKISDAVKAKIAHFLLSGRTFTAENLLNLSDGYDDRHQGVFANIISNNNDASDLRIYVGDAAGPYKQPLHNRRHDRGLHQRIATYSRPSKNKFTLKKHEDLLQRQGSCLNWVILVSFQCSVSKALVHIAHAVMVIIFGAYESGPYVACRPAQLPQCHETWGLNEIGPLGQHGMAGYNSIRHGRVQREIDLLHERNVFAGHRRQESRRGNHLERLVSGGPMHVNIFCRNGVPRRFFITPMTKIDGHHIDITIPRVIGLQYGLNSLHSVNVKFDLALSHDHSHPYASQAPSGSFPCKLGILISGTYPHGPHTAESFEYWVQCNRPEAVAKADRLASKVQSASRNVSYPMVPSGCEQATTLDNFLRGDPANNTEAVVNKPLRSDRLCFDRKTPAELVPDIGEASTSYEPDAFALCASILYQLRAKVQKKRMRAMDCVQRCLKTIPIGQLAKKVSEAIRPGVISMLKASGELEKLLSLRGDLDDKNQGVYADIVTMPDNATFRVYVGSAAGVCKGRKDSGLSRRIKEHIASMKKGSRPESGVLHATELKKAGTQPNFIILVRFSEEVDTPIVRLAEALMVVLFNTWDNEVFRSLRPADLTRISPHIGLNNANPLTGGFVVLSDLTYPEDAMKREEYMARCRSMGKRMSAHNMARILKNAREGGSVTVTRRPAAKAGTFQYGFKALGQQIFIPSGLATDLGLEVTRKVNVVYDISQRKPHRMPYACKTRYEDPSRFLGIKLRGIYGRGPMKGQDFQKWLQCGSLQAAHTARRIIDLIQQTGNISGAV